MIAAAPQAPAAKEWRPIQTAPIGRDFEATDCRDLRRCWRHRPSSRTDEILTWGRNTRFAATHWRELNLPTPPTAGQPADSTEGMTPNASRVG